MAEPVPDAPLRALGRRRKGEQVANILWPTPAMPSVSYGIPRACRGTCCALVWYRRAQNPSMSEMACYVNCGLLPI
jgi:hypothetical protein